MLKEKILDLLNEESISGACSVELVYKFYEKSTQVFEKVSQPLKCHLNFLGVILSESAVALSM